jgi:putative intracellular protease/amidase
MAPMRILIVLTSHDRLGDTDRQTGFWFEDFVSAWSIFADAGADIVLASPEGGAPPIDPDSDLPPLSDAALRFKSDRCARDALSDTLSLDQIDPGDFDGIFYPGGFGLLGDLVSDDRSIALIQAHNASGKPLGLVSHGPAALLRVRKQDGILLIAGRHLTALSDTEAAGLKPSLPTLSLGKDLADLGALYSQAPAGTSHVVRDGSLVTGQNSASAAGTAEALLKAIRGIV